MSLTASQIQVLKNKIKKEGSNYSINKAIEELLELASELSKYQNESIKQAEIKPSLEPKEYIKCLLSRVKKIQQEMGDVTIRMEQLNQLFNSKGHHVEKQIAIKIEKYTKKLNNN